MTDACSLGMIICSAGPEHTILHVNAAWCRLTGYSKEWTLRRGGDSSFLQGVDTDPESIAELKRAVANEESVKMEVLNYRQDGSSFWNGLTVAPVFLEGRATHFVGTISDVTETRRIRQAKQELDLFRLFDASFDLVTLIEVRDGKAMRLYSSQSHKTILGHEPESCNGDIVELSRLLPCQYRTDDTPKLIAAFEAGQIPDGFVGQIPYLHAEGHEVTFEYRISIDRTKPQQLMVISRDITDRRARQRLEEERRANEAQLDLFRLFDVSFDLMALIEIRDGKAMRLYSSQSHKTILGHEPESCNGDASKMPHLITDQYSIEETPKLVAAFEAGQIPDGFVGEVPHLNASGDVVWFEYRISIDPAKSRQFIVISRDITDRRERQRLEVEKARLEVEQKMDEEAVHTISHQLKNRFVALKGLVQSVRGTVQDHAPQLLQDPHNVRESLKDLLGQINGGIRVCLSETVVRMIAHDQYTRADAEFDLHVELEQLCGTRITLSIDANVPQRIMSDLNLVLHIAENFTSNATKYGPDDGEVRLHASLLPSHRLLLSVHNAAGEKHAELRERFGADSSALFHGGVGAHSDALSTRKGLAIAKKCARILGGDVSIRFEAASVVATLEFSYTILPASLCLPTSTLIASLDDNGLIRKMDCAMIKQMNIDNESAQHVRGATTDEICNFPEYVIQMERQPTLVIIDQNLDHPINHTEFMKGTELVRRLRELDFKGKIVIKSANAAPDDAKTYLASGADGVVAKGLDAFDMSRQLACILFGLFTLPDEAFDPRTIQQWELDERRELADEFISEANSLLMKLQGAIQSGAYVTAHSTLHAMKGICMNFGARRVGNMCNALRDRTMGKEEWEAELVNLRSALQQAFDFLEQVLAKESQT